MGWRNWESTVLSKFTISLSSWNRICGLRKNKLRLFASLAKFCAADQCDYWPEETKKVFVNTFSLFKKIITRRAIKKVPSNWEQWLVWPRNDWFPPEAEWDRRCSAETRKIRTSITRWPLYRQIKGEDIVYTFGNKRECDERTEMNKPLVYGLWYQPHRPVAMFSTDKRWKHLSAKPSSRLNFIDSRETNGLIGSKCKVRKDFSWGVLISHFLLCLIEDLFIQKNLKGIVLVAQTERPHPIPSRTRQLSSPVLMIAGPNPVPQK